MLQPFRRILTVLIPVLLFSAVSCSPSPKVIRVLTDRKELASAIEIYDTARDDIIITLRHVQSVDSALIEAEKPDLVIAENLNATAIVDKLVPMSIEMSGYPAIQGPRDSRDRPLLLPLSFRLTLIAGEQQAVAALPDTSTVRPDELLAAASALQTRDRDGRLTALGFSPSWNPLSFVDLLTARDPLILETGPLEMDETRLQPTIEEAGNWIVELAGSPSDDEAFSNKYRYVPDIRLIEDGRALFTRMEMDEWASLPDSVKTDLDIRYFRGERSIPVLSTVYAALPKGGRHRDETGEFLAWLVNGETQEILMERWERDGIAVFGFLGGLSTDPEVNDRLFPDRYPELTIPEAHYLSPVGLVPDRWARIRDEVLAPWIAAEAAAEARRRGGEEPGNGPSLADAYRIWDLSSLSESD